MAQLVQQARILDSNDCLVREVLHQRDLLFGKGAHFLAVDHNHANQLISPDHRHSYHAPRTAKFGQLRACTSWRCSIVRLVLHIGDLTCPLHRHRPSQESGASGIDDRMAPPLFSERKWGTMQRDGTKTIAFPKVERAEFRLTDARGILQHGLEDWL